MALLLFASFSSMNFSNLFTLSRICWNEKVVNVMYIIVDSLQNHEKSSINRGELHKIHLKIKL